MTSFVSRKFPIEMMAYGCRLTAPVTRQMYELCNTEILLSFAGFSHDLGYKLSGFEHFV
jgi:hypothetical protein